MSDKNFFLDTIDFDKKFAEFIKTVPVKYATQGLADAAFALLADADDEAPQTPYLTGDLRASRIIEKPVVTENGVEVKCGYNMAYAAYQHEGQRKDGSHIVEFYTRTQVYLPGPKFIESKMVRWKNKYMQIAVDYIKTKIEGGRA